MDIFVYLTLCFTSLFTLMDPLGVMPVFLQMTDGMDTKERRCIALKACTIAFSPFYIIGQVSVSFFRHLNKRIPDCGRYHHL